MNQSRKLTNSTSPVKTKSSDPGDLHKKKLQALRERHKAKEQENYKRLENTFKPLQEKEEFDRFFTVKEKLYATRLERERTRDAILGVKAEFDEMKLKLKGFIQDQIVSSAKLSVPKTQNKAKTITQ